ncbi:MAG: DUF4093 domain-containing protein, partial [Clostridium sp.]
IRALNGAKCELKEKRSEFTIQDMHFFKLTADKDARKRRDAVGRELGIGYSNTNQLLTRLNNYGISKEEFIEAMNKIDKEI